MAVKTAAKSANVNARMQQDIKKQAEDILAELGIPRSVAMDMYYRQIIMHHGIPFKVTVPWDVPVRDEMSKAESDQMRATGLKQAKEDDSFDVDEVFDELEKM